MKLKRMTLRRFPQHCRFLISGGSHEGAGEFLELSDP